MRERWFFVEGARRRGPLSLEQVIAAVLAAAEPRSVLVWRKGLRDWTRADTVPQLEDQLARLRPANDPDASGPARVAPAPADGRPPSRSAGHLLTLSVVGVGLVALLATLWLARPRARPLGGPVPLGIGGPKESPAVLVPSTPTAVPTAQLTPGPVAPATSLRATGPAPSRVAAAEADLPGSELPRLKGVAAWSGEALRLTVYNGTDWRVTELHVKIERLAGEDFVEDAQPVVLQPPPEPVDAGVASLLQRVVPDRKKPGLNPLDTGVFEGRAGAMPEAFRWRIESGRGYPPQR